MMKQNQIEALGIDHIDCSTCLQDLCITLSIEGGVDAIFEELESPRRLQGIAVCICETGWGELMIDSKIFSVKAGDLFIILPGTILHSLKKSDDIRLVVLGVSPEFLASSEIVEAIPLYLFIKEHPCISLNQADRELILELWEMLRDKSARTVHPYRLEIAGKLLMILFYEISAIYSHRKPIEEQRIKRNDELLAGFLRLVEQYYQSERNLEFYASELCVTSKYLSKVVKLTSGRTTTEWIAWSVVVHAKSLLRTSDLNVAQIAERLNFPNASFFCQYFKRHTGITPKAYRSS